MESSTRVGETTRWPGACNRGLLSWPARGCSSMVYWTVSAGEWKINCQWLACIEEGLLSINALRSCDERLTLRIFRVFPDWLIVWDRWWIVTYYIEFFYTLCSNRTRGAYEVPLYFIIFYFFQSMVFWKLTQLSKRSMKWRAMQFNCSSMFKMSAVQKLQYLLIRNVFPNYTDKESP